jgi:hypothetical protein
MAVAARKDAGLSLTKSEAAAIHIAISGIGPRLAAARRGEDGRGLFENLPDHNPPRERKKGGDFLIFLGRNPLKSPDSEK